MEEEKMQRLYDTLAKLAPKHASGLGMLKGVGHIAHRRDETLPQNPLYSRFVRAGSGIGQYHKRSFDEENKEGNADETKSSPEADDEEDKTSKKAKKEKKEKKDKKDKKEKKDKKDKKEKKDKEETPVAEQQVVEESSSRKRKREEEVEAAVDSDESGKKKSKSKKEKKDRK